MSNIKLSAIEVERIRRMRGSIGCPADIRPRNFETAVIANRANVSASQHDIDNGCRSRQTDEDGEPITQRVFFAMELVASRSYLARLQPLDPEVEDHRRKQHHDDSARQEFHSVQPEGQASAHPQSFSMRSSAGAIRTQYESATTQASAVSVEETTI